MPRKTDTGSRHKRGDLPPELHLLESAFNGLDEGVVVCDPEGRVLLVNPSAERIGLGMTETSPDRWADEYGLFLPDKKTPAPRDQLPLPRALRGESSGRMALFMRNPKIPLGQDFSVRWSRLQDDAGRTTGILVTFHDVTRFKEIENSMNYAMEQLQNQTDFTQTILNSTNDGIVLADAGPNLLFANPSCERIVGMEITDPGHEKWSETYGLFYPDKETLVPTDQLPLIRALQGEATGEEEFFICNESKPAGTYISASAYPIRRRDTNEVFAALAIFRDITDYKRIQSELERSFHEMRNQTELMQTVFDSMGDGVIVADQDGKYLMQNPAVKDIGGMTIMEGEVAKRPERYGLFQTDGVTPFPADELPLIRAIRGESTDNVELLIRNKEKPQGVHVSATGRPLRRRHGVPNAGVVVIRDMTKMKEIENTLRATVEKLDVQTHAMEAVFNGISDGVVVANEKGEFTIFNPSAERIAGMGATDTSPDQWSDTYGLFFRDKITPMPPDEVPLVRAIRGESTDDVEMFIRNPRIPEGAYLSVSGRPLRDERGQSMGGVVVFRDVTAHVEREEALLQAFAEGRLEIVDTILHNIGNAMNSVAIGVDQIHQQLQKDKLLRRFSSLANAIAEHRDDWITYLQTDSQGQKVLPFILALDKDLSHQNVRLRRSAERVQSRVTHIVDIIRTQKSFDERSSVRKEISLQQAVMDAVKILEDSLSKRGIEVSVDCRRAPSRIWIHGSRFHQMLVNLVKNAIEAIDDLANAGELEAKPFIRINADVREDALVLDVIDSGIGMEPDRLKIIFSPGYTTKKEGSGLGLHSAANFVIGTGGSISPSSRGIGRGTTIRVKFRLASLRKELSPPKQE